MELFYSNGNTCITSDQCKQYSLFNYKSLCISECKADNPYIKHNDIECHSNCSDFIEYKDIDNAYKNSTPT